MQVKQQQNDLLSSKKLEENKIAPLKKSVEKMDAKLVKYRQELNTARTNNMNMIKKVKKKFEEDSDRVEALVNEIMSDLHAQERTEKERLKRVYTCKQKIGGLQAELNDLRSQGDGEGEGNINSTLLLIMQFRNGKSRVIKGMYFAL